MPRFSMVRKTAGRDSQAHEALFALQPESMRMQIRQEAAALAIVRMGHRVTGFRAFARDLADSRHDLDLVLDAEKSRALYQPGIGEASRLRSSSPAGERPCKARPTHEIALHARVPA